MALRTGGLVLRPRAHRRPAPIVRRWSRREPTAPSRPAWSRWRRGLANIQGGTLVGIAVTSKRRARRSARCTHAGRVHRARLHPPDLAGPAGSSATPDAVVARLHAAVVQALKHPAVVERLPSQGFYAEGESGATFGALLDSSYLSFEAVV